MGEVHLGKGGVLHEFIGVRLVVQLDSPVARVERRDNTQGGIEVRSLRADVVRFAEVVVVHLTDDGGVVVTVLNNDIVIQHDEDKQ